MHSRLVISHESMTGGIRTHTLKILSLLTLPLVYRPMPHIIGHSIWLSSDLLRFLPTSHRFVQMRVNHSPLLQAAIANSLAIIFYNRVFNESLLPDPDISLVLTKHQSNACTAPSSGAEGNRTPVLNVVHRRSTISKII